MKTHFLKNILVVLLLISLKLGAQTNIKVESYVQRYKKAALNDQYTYGIPAAITLAQGINESGIGESYLARSGNNHFGIKCGSKWKGATISKDDDAKNECFRKYASAEESFDDHSKFLVENARYASLFQLSPQDYKSWAYGLKRAGYATSPTYAEDLIETIEKYKLNRWANESPDGVAQKNAAEENLHRINDHKYKMIPWDSTFTYKGLKAFYVYAGKSLTPISRHYRMPLKKMLKLNDLDTDLIPESSIMYLEPKPNIGDDSFYVVPAGQSTVWKLSQLAAINIEDLKFLNNLKATDIPLPGEKLALIAKNPNPVRLNGQSNVTNSVELDLGNDNTVTQTPSETIDNAEVKVVDASNENIESQEDYEYEDTDAPKISVTENPTIAQEETSAEKPTKVVETPTTRETVQRTIEIDPTPDTQDYTEEPNTIGQVASAQDGYNNYEVEEDYYEEADIEVDNLGSTEDTSKNPKIEGEELIHIVSDGENLNMISLLYRVDKSIIMERNNMSSENVSEGQKLVIPPMDYKKPEPVEEVVEEIDEFDEVQKAIENAIGETVEETVEEVAEQTEKISSDQDTKTIKKVAEKKPEPKKETTKEEKTVRLDTRTSDPRLSTVTEEIFIYEKDGNQKGFDIDNLPDESWEYVGRIERDIPNKKQPKADKKEDEKVTKKDKPKEEPKTETKKETKTQYYTVKNGDNLFRIAKKFGVSTDDIVKANKKDNQMVYVGEKLKIPGTAKTPQETKPQEKKPEPKKETTKKTESKDTKKAETEKKKDTPAVETGETDHGYKVAIHTVAEGENLYRISLKYNMTMKAIKRLNNLTNETVEVGQKIKVYK